jgi:outer membrane protein assembly factor BamB
MTSLRCQSAAVCLVIAFAVAGSGCSDSTGVDQLVSVGITPVDTLIWTSDVLTLEATAEYQSGPGVPDSVEWAVSDSTVLSLSGGTSAQVTATALASGEVEVVALINELADTAAVKVVTPGDVRWRADLAGSAQQPGVPSLDEQGRIYVVRSESSEGLLIALEPDATEIYSVPTCHAGQSPGLSLTSGAVFVTGTACTQGHAITDGAVQWTHSFGDLDAGVALDTDGSVVVIHSFQGMYLSRISASGTEIWRDTLLATTPTDARTAPVIASDGEIYVSSNAVSGRVLARVAPDGTIRWSVPIPNQGFLQYTNPALFENRIVVTYTAGNNGLAVFDTSGTLVWDRATAGSLPSSPVIDAEGNIYLQTSTHLFAYDPQGAELWSNNQLVSSQCGSRPSAPTLLQSDQIVVHCKFEDSCEMCSVNQQDGSLIWRSEIGERVWSAAAVAADGTVYAVTATALIALWNDIAPLTEGWPTEGGNMQRQRRQ